MATDNIARGMAGSALGGVKKAEGEIQQVNERVDEANRRIDKLNTIFHFKGSKPSIEDLPTEGNQPGDVWSVNGTEYAWTLNDETGEYEWKNIGDIVDLDAFIMKTDIVQELGDSETKIMSQKAVKDAIENQSKGMYNNIEKVQTYLYTTEYDNLDYEFANNFLNEDTGSYETRYGVGGCSAVRKGGLYGRSFDWTYDDSIDFIVKTSQSGGKFATIGVANGGYRLDKTFVESGNFSDEYRTVPFRVVDGMNEKGVVVNSNVVPRDKGETAVVIPHEEVRDSINMLALPRFILDRFGDATEAVEYIRDYVKITVYQPLKNIGYDLHFMIADKDKTYILEFVESQSVIIDVSEGATGANAGNSYMTNFFISDMTPNSDGSVYTPETQDSTHNAMDTNGVTEHGCGLERYNLIVDAFDDIEDIDDMRALLSNLKYTKTYSTASVVSDPYWYTEFVGGDLSVVSDVDDFDNIVEQSGIAFTNRTRDREGQYFGTWQTTHSCIYDIDKREVYIIVQENGIEQKFDFEYYYDVKEIDEKLDEKEDKKIDLGGEDLDIYIDPVDGDDTGDGSSDFPVKTWARAVEIMNQNVNCNRFNIKPENCGTEATALDLGGVYVENKNIEFGSGVYSPISDHAHFSNCTIKLNSRISGSSSTYSILFRPEDNENSFKFSGNNVLLLGYKASINDWNGTNTSADYKSIIYCDAGYLTIDEVGVNIDLRWAGGFLIGAGDEEGQVCIKLNSYSQSIFGGYIRGTKTDRASYLAQSGTVVSPIIYLSQDTDLTSLTSITDDDKYATIIYDGDNKPKIDLDGQDLDIYIDPVSGDDSKSGSSDANRIKTWSRATEIMDSYDNVGVVNIYTKNTSDASPLDIGGFIENKNIHFQKHGTISAYNSAYFSPISKDAVFSNCYVLFHYGPTLYRSSSVNHCVIFRGSSSLELGYQGSLVDEYGAEDYIGAFIQCSYGVLDIILGCGPYVHVYSNSYQLCTFTKDYGQINFTIASYADIDLSGGYFCDSYGYYCPVFHVGKDFNTGDIGGFTTDDSQAVIIYTGEHKPDKINLEGSYINLYIDKTNGKDSNDGTSGHPVKTMSRFISLLQSYKNGTIIANCQGSGSGIQNISGSFSDINIVFTGSGWELTLSGDMFLNNANFAFRDYVTFNRTNKSYQVIASGNCNITFGYSSTIKDTGGSTGDWDALFTLGTSNNSTSGSLVINLQEPNITINSNSEELATSYGFGELVLNIQPHTVSFTNSSILGYSSENYSCTINVRGEASKYARQWTTNDNYAVINYAHQTKVDLEGRALNIYIDPVDGSDNYTGLSSSSKIKTWGKAVQIMDRYANCSTFCINPYNTSLSAPLILGGVSVEDKNITFNSGYYGLQNASTSVGATFINCTLLLDHFAVLVRPSSNSGSINMIGNSVLSVGFTASIYNLYYNSSSQYAFIKSKNGTLKVLANYAPYSEFFSVGGFLFSADYDFGNLEFTFNKATDIRLHYNVSTEQKTSYAGYLAAASANYTVTINADQDIYMSDMTGWTDDDSRVVFNWSDNKIDLKGQQCDVYIDPTNGNDNNTGLSSSSKLKTWAAVSRIISRRKNGIISIHSDSTAGVPLYINGTFEDIEIDLNGGYFYLNSNISIINGGLRIGYATLYRGSSNYKISFYGDCIVEHRGVITDGPSASTAAQAMFYLVNGSLRVSTFLSGTYISSNSQYLFARNYGTMEFFLHSGLIGTIKNLVYSDKGLSPIVINAANGITMTKTDWSNDNSNLIINYPLIDLKGQTINFYVDSVNGNDNNTGLSSNQKIKTMDKLKSMLYSYKNGCINVNITNNLQMTSSRLSLSNIRLDFSGSIDVSGQVYFENVPVSFYNGTITQQTRNTYLYFQDSDAIFYKGTIQTLSDGYDFIDLKNSNLTFGYDDEYETINHSNESEAMCLGIGGHNTINLAYVKGSITKLDMVNYAIDNIYVGDISQATIDSFYNTSAISRPNVFYIGDHRPSKNYINGSQISIYIDTVNGSDSNSGLDSSHKIKTWGKAIDIMNGYEGAIQFNIIGTAFYSLEPEQYVDIGGFLENKTISFQSGGFSPISKNAVFSNCAIDLAGSSTCLYRADSQSTSSKSVLFYGNSSLICGYNSTIEDAKGSSSYSDAFIQQRIGHLNVTIGNGPGSTIVCEEGMLFSYTYDHGSIEFTIAPDTTIDMPDAYFTEASPEGYYSPVFNIPKGLDTTQLLGFSENDDYAVINYSKTKQTFVIDAEDWSASTGTGPFAYTASVTADHSIGIKEMVELVNNNPVLFATCGIALSSVSGAIITFIAVTKPTDDVSLTVLFEG